MIHVSTVHNDASGDLDPVYRILREYNESKNPGWFATGDDPQSEPQPLNLVARKEDGKVLGGLTATTSLSWLKVSIMAVEESHRSQGIGRMLLNACHTEAIRRGCHYSFLDTMDHQAPQFYQRLGYQLIGRIPDWDSFGHAKCFFTMTLAER